MATSCAFRLYPASPASSGRGPRPKSLISSRIAAICPTVKPSTENVSTKPGQSTVTKALPSLTGADLEGLELSAMGQADAEELASWRYPGIYSFYDVSADPDDQTELLDPRRRQDAYFSASVPGFGLIGFAYLKPRKGGALELGLGLRPECTGRGIGAEFGGRICRWASEHDARVAGAPRCLLQRTRHPCL